MRYLLTILILFIHVSVFLPTLQASDKNIGTAGATFLKIGIGARALGLGGTYASIGDDIDTIFHNPAGLNSTTNQELSFMHLEYFVDICYEYFGYSKRLSFNRVLAGSLSYLHMKDFTGWDTVGNEKDNFSAHDSLFNITYAQNLIGNISIGSNIKFIQQKLANYSSKSIALDLGFLGISDTEALRYGICLQNIGNKVKFDKAENKLPLNIKLGISYKYLDEAMVTGLDVDFPYDHKINYHFGSEYTLLDIFAFRLGYQSGPAEYTNGLCGGFGFKYNNFCLDYAFIPYCKELGNSHYISLLYKFGSELEETKQSKIKKYKKYEKIKPTSEEKSEKISKETLKKKSSLKPKRELLPKKYISSKSTVKPHQKYHHPKESKYYSHSRNNYFSAKHPNIKSYDIYNNKFYRPQEKHKKVKRNKSLEFETYVDSDIFKSQNEFIVRENRQSGTWTIKKDFFPKPIFKKSYKPSMKKKKYFYAYKDYKMYPSEYPSYYKRYSKPLKTKKYSDALDTYKYYKKEKPTITYNDWQYYSYDPDTYEYFKNKYGLKEDDSTFISEKYPDLKTYSIEKPPAKEIKEEIKVPSLSLEETTPLKETKKEEISQEETIWKNISEEIIEELSN
ncbi:MAG: PorV/PorQ family protein [bacterium]|nr:PorV/PorQ family protein [bacterium]